MAELETIHKRAEDARKSAQRDGFHWTDLKVYRRYYRGIQRGTLNADQMRIMATILNNRFSHNVAKKIVDEKAYRIGVARFDVDDEQVEAYLKETWVKNQMPDLVADAARSLKRDGDTYLGLSWIVDPGSIYGGRVGINVERAWDGKQGMFMVYDDFGNPEYAVKEWFNGRDGKRYRTFYFPSFIQRFVSQGEGWQVFRLPGDPANSAGIVPWVKSDGSPLGIPVVHIPNGNDDDSNYGVSELAGGVLGFQDQINAIQHDITAVAMLTGSPRTWSRGFDIGTNPATGEANKPRTGPGAHWHVEDETADWGQIMPGEVRPLADALWLKVQSVCQMTNIPMHIITGQWPSGEAIFRAEMPLVQDVETSLKKIGPGLSTLMHRATEMANTFGRAVLNESKLITVVFMPVDRRDPLTLALYAEKIAPYVSEAEVLRVLNYGPDRIKQIQEEREEEAAKAIERQQAAFNAGAGPSFLNPNDRLPDDEDEA